MEKVIFLVVCLACAGQGRRAQLSSEQLPRSQVTESHMAFEAAPSSQHDVNRSHLPESNQGTSGPLQSLTQFLLTFSPAVAFVPAPGSLLPMHSHMLTRVQPDVLDEQQPPSHKRLADTTRPRTRAPLAAGERDILEDLKYQLSNADPESRPFSDVTDNKAGALYTFFLILTLGWVAWIIIKDQQQRRAQNTKFKEQREAINMFKEQGRDDVARMLEIDLEKEIVKEEEPEKKKKWKPPPVVEEIGGSVEDAGNRYIRRNGRAARRERRKRNSDVSMSVETSTRRSPLASMGLLSALSSSPLSLGPDMNVERLGFGTWSWGNKLLWGYDPEADAELQQAFNEIITPSNPFDSRRYFFDTGDSYGTGELEGRAEELLGKFRRESKAPDRAIIGTKLAVYPWRLTGASFEEACRASLKRMGRDQMEIVQAHWSAQNFQPWQEPALWDGLARCYEAGLCKAVGTSNYGPEQLIRVNEYWRERGVPHALNQVQLSLLSTLPIESGLLDACEELGVQAVGYSPLALGVLSDKYDLDNLPKGPRGLLFKQLLPSIQPLLRTMREIAKNRGVSCSAVAINWAMTKGALVIVGAKTPEQVRDNMQACGWRLSTAEVVELEVQAKKGRKATQNIFQTA